jgi:threonyl-tRNA synthetase
MVKITYPDGSFGEFDSGVCGIGIAKKIGEKLARDAVAVKVNGVAVDLFAPITVDAKIQILTFRDKEGKEIFWHSSAHVLAMAVRELWPDVKLAVGPSIENGFYYDFEKKAPFVPEDLEKIEAKISEIVKKDLPFVRKEVSLEEAEGLFKDNKFKLELAGELKEGISVYSVGGFVDLCRGPHVVSTGKIKAVKLTKVSSSYWRGDSSKESLQRVYGISFPDRKELKDYFKLIEEAEKRDHKRIGRELEIFMLHEFALPGSPFFLPKGAAVYNELLKFVRAEYAKSGYQEVITPLIYKKKLWETSGHWEHYKDNMFCMKIGDEEYSLKPMNCPSHCLVYQNKVHSYKELPLRIADFACLHRNELGGVLGGITRVTKFSQDDAHIFLAEEQIPDEIARLLKMVNDFYKVFNFEYSAKVSTRPEKFMGDIAVWNRAEESLKNALEQNGVKFTISDGEGAFYGPKIDFDIKDALGRPWQCATIQLDFQLPLRFGLSYEGRDGRKHTPVMIHRAIFGSLERFMGVITEYYAGRFPLWLNPNQVVILPVADRFSDYADEVAKALSGRGIRVDVDGRTETIARKVRDAELQKYNYILVVGEQEIGDKTVTVRTRDNKIEGEIKYADFAERVVKEIESKLG